MMHKRGSKSGKPAFAVPVRRCFMETSVYQEVSELDDKGVSPVISRVSSRRTNPELAHWVWPQLCFSRDLDPWMEVQRRTRRRYSQHVDDAYSNRRKLKNGHQGPGGRGTERDFHRAHGGQSPGTRRGFRPSQPGTRLQGGSGGLQWRHLPAEASESQRGPPRLGTAQRRQLAGRGEGQERVPRVQSHRDGPPP